MKKNNETIENVNVVENNEQFINENISLVPKVMMNRFMKMSIDEQVRKIQHYKLVQQIRESNKVVNRVKDLFEKRNATIDDVKDVLEFCKEFINSAKDREIAAIDEEIARLIEKKNSMNI